MDAIIETFLRLSRGSADRALEIRALQAFSHHDPKREREVLADRP